MNGNLFIDAELARDVMGWSVVQAGGEEWLEKAIEGGARCPIFAYWSEGGSMVIEDPISVTKTREFHPSSDERHAMEVAAQLIRDKSVSLAFDISERGATVTIKKGNEVVSTEFDMDKLAPAVAKACLKAARRLKKG